MPRILTGPCTQNEGSSKLFSVTPTAAIASLLTTASLLTILALQTIRLSQLAQRAKTNNARHFQLLINLECHKVLEHLYADGIPPEEASIPSCDVASEFLLKPTPLSSFNGVMIWKKEYPVQGKPCTLDRDRGVVHDTVKPSVRYYFDYETTACLAFEYLGSGGNDNNYEEISDCILSCTYQDYTGCPGKYPVARGPDGEPFICEIPRTTSSPGENVRISIEDETE
ncbi:unnamed protein product [Angiostrongylus costaricensis]|uniref:BPTI/Kunitz inhibitor domain-containing protein n=1 Tax=Angiostrongylus costaricensis TaxID=334426 RepID=A0A158PGT3_ANGCS|nr:unnamed protein product [Angiostrongylus costaricensis]